jgi:microcompartment protein CcmL/EutN
MKRAAALAVLDFAGIPAGLDATDAMLKKAPVAFFRSGTVTAGRYLTLVGGTPASVDEALAEGLARAEGHLLDHLYLADVHPRLLDALEGRRGAEGTGPLLILETATASSVVLACEKVLKGTLVDLVEVRLCDAGLAGKGLALFRGDLHELEAAVEILASVLPPAAGASHRVLARPFDAFARENALSTAFAASRFVDLGGEEAS